MNAPTRKAPITGRGKARRAGGKTQSLPGAPGDEDFEAAVLRVPAGLPAKEASAGAIHASIKPRSMRHGWMLVEKSAEWHGYSQATRDKNSRLASEWLASPVTEGADLRWADAPVADLRRRHVKAILADHAATPHKAKHLLVMIRKIIGEALDQDWIEIDPTHKISWQPDYAGWRAWTADEMRAFLARWPAGTTPHMAFCLALWLGNRRGDIAALQWSQRQTRALTIRGEKRIVPGFVLTPKKRRGKTLFVPESTMLTAALAAAPRTGETVLMTAYGKPFSPKSLTGRMADWTASAGLPKGCTLHGLRKTLGKALAEGGASTRQLMDVLGHDDTEHAELYSREAEQAILAVDAMDKIAGFLDE